MNYHFQTFPTASHAWQHVLRRLYHAPAVESRIGSCRELLGCSFTIDNPHECWIGNMRSASIGYGYAELLWYLSGSNTMEMLLHYAPSYLKYCNDGKAMGAPGYRWANNPGIKAAHKNSLTTAIELLKKNSNDRRAVVLIWDSSDVHQAQVGEWNDIPCSLSFQLLLRDNKLHMIYNMRSNDIWMGAVYDIFTACQIQIMIAIANDWEVGSYTHNVGSIHLYEKHMPLVEKYNTLETSISNNFLPLIEKDEARNMLQGASHFQGMEEDMRHNKILLPDDISQFSNAWSLHALKHMRNHLQKKLNK